MRILKISPIVFAVGIIALGVVSCKSKKNAGPSADEVFVDIPCSGPDYFTDKKFFRSNAIGESLDQMTAKKKAMSNARAQLATDMSSTMKIVGDNYVKSSEFNNKEEVTETFQQNARTVVDQSLTGIRIICERQVKTTEGKYKTYIAIELSADKILSKYNERLSKDESLKADYNYEKFKDTFDEEMSKMAN